MAQHVYYVIKALVGDSKLSSAMIELASNGYNVQIKSAIGVASDKTAPTIDAKALEAPSSSAYQKRASHTRNEKGVHRNQHSGHFRHPSGKTMADFAMEFLRGKNKEVHQDEVIKHVSSLGFQSSGVPTVISALFRAGKIIIDEDRNIVISGK